MSDSSPLAFLIWLLALLAAGGVGLAALRLLGVSFASRIERWLFGCALGLGLLAYAVLAIGLAAALRPASLWSLLALFFVISLPGYTSLFREKHLPATARAMRNAECGGTDGAPQATGRRGETAASNRPVAPSPQVAPSPPIPHSAFRIPHWERLLTLVLFLYLAGIAALTLIGSLAPPTDLDWDSLVYHLAAPKIYLAHGRIHLIAYDSHTNFPFTLEMLYTLGLGTGGVVAAKLFHWTFAWLTALAVALLTRAVLGPRGPGWAAPLAAAVFAGVPQVAWEATTAYIDLGTTLYQFLALAAFMAGVGGWGLGVGSDVHRDRACELGQAGEGTEELSVATPNPQPPTPNPSLLLSGLMSGWAMGTKMTAVIPFALLAAWLGWYWLRSRDRVLLRAGAAFVLAATLVASPWYVKSYLWTNNPVYPFFYRFFPRSINWNQAADAGYRAEQWSFGRGHDAGAFLSLPWDVTMHGADFYNVAFKNAPRGSPRRQIGDILGGISATFLALLPLALFLDRWDRRLSWLLSYSGAMLVVWFFLTQQTRYLLPVLAPLAVVVAVTVAWLRRPVLQRAAALFLALTFLLHARWLYGEVAPAIDVVTGSETRRAYLDRYQPDLYPALEFINTLPPGSRVAFFQEVRGFYSDRDYFWANPGQNTIVPYDTFRDGRELALFLRHRLGLTHALVNYVWFTPEMAGQRWVVLLDDAIHRGALVPVYQTTTPFGRTLVVVYRIEPGMYPPR